MSDGEVQVPHVGGGRKIDCAVVMRSGEAFFQPRVNVAGTTGTPLDVAVAGDVAVVNGSATPLDVALPAGSQDVNITNAAVPVTTGVPLEVVNPAAGSLDVDVGNFPATQDVNVTNFPASQTVDGSLTAVGTITNPVQVDDSTPIDVAVTNPVTAAAISSDAGGRQRVSQLTTIWDGKMINEACIDCQYDAETVGTGTAAFRSSDNDVLLTTAAASDVGIWQTQRRFPYLSGKSQQVEFTTVDFAPETNVTKRVGYFSSNTTTPFDSNKDGAWLESDGSTVRLRISRNGVDVINVPQASWNQDVLAGYDWDTFTVCIIDFLWLGGAILRLFVKNPAGGFTLCHQYDHAGLGTDTFMLSPHQPIRAEIRQSGAGSGSFRHICNQLSTEGALSNVFRGVCVPTPQDVDYVDTDNTDYALLSVRLLSTTLDSIVLIRNFLGIVTTGGDDCFVFLSLNPTIGGTPNESWTTHQSGLFEFATYSSDPVITDRGVLLAGGYMGSRQGFTGGTANDDTTRYLSAQIDGTPNVFTIGVQTYSGGQDVAACFNLELF